MAIRSAKALLLQLPRKRSFRTPLCDEESFVSVSTVYVFSPQVRSDDRY
jgi:hypothetical protein